MHSEVLDERQLSLLPRLGAFAGANGFYLGGGTAVAQRGSRKDFVDLYVLATEHVPIRSALELYQHKYGTQDIAHVLLGLSYFDDADSEPPPVLLTDLPWEEVKRQFQEWTRGLAGR